MRKKKLSMYGRFVAIFMTIVLLATVMPKTVKAERKFTYTKKYQFKNLISNDALYMAVEQWYIYEEYSGTKYELSVLSEENKEIGVTIPYESKINIYLCHKNGKTSWDSGAPDNPVFNTTSIYIDYMYVFWYMDGEDVLDCVLWNRSDIALKGYVPNPVKPGYIFDGWVDKYGNALSQDIFLMSRTYETGELCNHEVYIYATWKPHEHQWNQDEWNKDENSHWHECIAEGCPITEDSEKDGYALHDFSGKTEVVKEPKCYETGLERVYCAQEGCDAYEERVIDKLPHEYEEDWKYDSEIHYHKCKNCENCIDEENHLFTEWKIVNDATFTEDGIKERKCQTCEYKEEEIIPKLSEGHIHDFSGRNEIVKEPKCYETGLEKVYCTLDECGAYEENVIDKLPHEYEDDWRYSDVIHYHKCENCDFCTDEENHLFTEWEIVKEPTLLEEGLEERHCTECEYAEEKVIEKLLDSHIHEYTGREEIVTAPSCTQEGVKKIYCKDEQCGEFIEELIPMTDHDYEIWWLYNEDSHYHKCKNCDTCKDEAVHDMVETNMVKLPTEKAPGVMELECVVCRYIKYKEIPYEKPLDKEEPSDDILPPDDELPSNNELPPDDELPPNNNSPSYDELPPNDKSPSNNDAPPFAAPETRDIHIIHIYATLAMIGGMTYLLYYFRPLNVGISKEKKEEVVEKLIKWAKSKNGFTKGIALFSITLILLYYHFVANFIATPSENTDIVQ